MTQRNQDPYEIYCRNCVDDKITPMSKEVWNEMRATRANQPQNNFEQKWRNPSFKHWFGKPRAKK